MGKFIFYTFVILSIYSGYKIFNIFSDDEIPNFSENVYWGPKSKENGKEDNSISPFKIQIEENILADLKSRLKRELDENRITPPLEGIGFQYGFNTDYLKEYGNYWLNEYNWRKREEMLNKWPNFKTNINGIDIHFQHAKSENDKKYKVTRPLLLLHGWPDSFIDFQNSIPGLIEPRNSDVNFELIIPSLPGYGFSEGPHKPGMDGVAWAQILKKFKSYLQKLMQRLGHEKFYIQGGDMGGIGGVNLADLYPEKILGIHLNGCGAMHPRSNLWNLLGLIFPDIFMTKLELKYSTFSTIFNYMMREMGYLHIQVTKPDTIGVGLSNSPLGLLAYIVEKFSTETNRNWMDKRDGGLEYYKKDDILDNIMVYWISNSITTSMRSYADVLANMNLQLNAISTKVPMGCLKAPEEVLHMNERAIRAKFNNLVQNTEVEKGGHFFAFEQPELYTQDLIKFINKVENDFHNFK